MDSVVAGGFVYVTARGIRAWDGVRLVTCEFAVAGAHQEIADAVWCDHEALVRLITRSDADAVLEALGAVVSGRSDGGGVPVATPLRTVLRASLGSSIPTHTLAYTHTEALWLAADEGTNRIALRRFVSRISDSVRQAAYAGLVAGREIGVAGDVASATNLMRAAAVANAITHPITLKLVDASVTGELRVDGSGAIRGEGRLAITEVKRRARWQLPGGIALWHSRGDCAHPNLASIDPWEHIDEPLPRASGVAEAPPLADAVCAAEGIERFVSGDVPKGSLIRAPANALTTSGWLDPTSIVAYGEAQRERLGVRRFDSDEPMWWVAGERGGRAVMIPAALVFYPFLGIPSCVHGSAVSSNGVAAHTTKAAAVTSAWLEAVERDAFQRARIIGAISPPDRVERESVLERIAAALISGLEAFGEVSICHLQSPTSIPVLLVRADTPEQLALGMGAHPSPQAALRKALEECYAHATGPFRHTVTMTAVDGPGDHAALYRDPADRAVAEWMLIGRMLPLADISPSRSPQLPIDAAVYEFPAQNDLAVARVIDPGLIPLTFGYDSDPTGRLDVQSLMARAGLSFDVPLYPHPFA